MKLNFLFFILFACLILVKASSDDQNAAGKRQKLDTNFCRMFTDRVLCIQSSDCFWENEKCWYKKWIDFEFGFLCGFKRKSNCDSRKCVLQNGRCISRKSISS